MEFTYHRLARNSTEIRLVRLLETSCKDSPLSLELCHASINDANYVALSYVWGDMANTVEILQENNFHGWLWVDSLCIQQSNIDEKSYQVGQMGTIFSKADCVFSWLGQGTRETDRALDFVSRVGPRALKVGPLDLSERDDVYDYLAAKNEFHACFQKLLLRTDTESKWSELAQFALDLLREPGLQLDSGDEQSLVAGIDEILAREYWLGIWIHQEVALAKRVFILCGTRVLSLDQLAATFKSLRACINSDIRLHPETSSFVKYWDLWTFYCLPLDVRDQFIRGIGSPLANILYREHGPPDSPWFLATEPRDVVFALLGLISDGDSLGIQPDYSMAVAQTFITVTKAFIDREYQSCSTYNLVSMVPRNESDNPHNLPSWVPDWHKVGQGSMNDYRINTGWYFNVTPYTMMQPRPLASLGDTLRVLRQRGCRVGVITEVMVPPKEAGEDGSDASTGDIAESWLSVTMEFAQLGCEPSPGEDYVWRTLLATRWRGVIHASMKEASKTLVRDFMRRRHVDADFLTLEQIEFVKRLRSPLDRSQDLETLSGLVRYAGKRLQEHKIHHHGQRTLFKTTKGMFGLGYRTVQPGDVVTLLLGLGSPVILRPCSESDGGGFTYLGDAYVDGIMYGEFLRNDPALEDFSIH
ncbi:heterokaryon incompatibility protein-domain-containing protein [Mariannaea sp. PMI_226]|nr:heterokaryon incompatibility protein-domain-containing protein [Mariannaea sp. PMI_226]